MNSVDMSKLYTLLLARKDGAVVGSDLVNWAVQALLDGSNTLNLRILAGLSNDVVLPEAEVYFWRALNELGVPLPADEELEAFRAAGQRRYAGEVARQMMLGQVSLREGLEIIHTSVVSPLGHPKDLMFWCYLKDGIDPDTGKFIADMGKTYELLLTEEWKQTILRWTERYLQQSCIG